MRPFVFNYAHHAPTPRRRPHPHRRPRHHARTAGRASATTAHPRQSPRRRTLIDGFGGRPIRNSVILVDGERITAVGQAGQLAIPGGAEVISTEGMSVLPGLWDMHVHLMINGHADYTHWAG